MADKRAALLAIILVYSGITQAFFFGSLPLFINSYSTEITDESIKLVLFFLSFFLSFFLFFFKNHNFFFSFKVFNGNFWNF